MIIMFLNCNGLPQKRLYFKRRVSHNIKQNLSILPRGLFFFPSSPAFSATRSVFLVLGAVSFHLHPRLEGRHTHLKQMANAFYVETQAHQKVFGDQRQLAAARSERGRRLVRGEAKEKRLK